MQHETIDGTILSLIYQNEENGYTVLRLVTGDGEMVTVVGCIPCAAPGENLIVTGVWMHHPTHGEQLKAEQVERHMPTTETEILSYLSSGAVKGVGPATAQRLVERFGDTGPADCEENLAALDRLAAYCTAHGIRLRAVWMPWNGKLEIYPAARSVMDAADERMAALGIEVLDATRVVPEEYFFDTGHLNYDVGSPWFTDWLDPWLAEEG